MTRERKRRPIADRFWEKVDRRSDTECWPWMGARGRGYGVMNIDGKTVGAHRISYELNVGAIPDGLVTDHLCRNPICVNPGHLEPVSMGENTRRGLLYECLAARAAQLTHCKRGHEFSAENTRIIGRSRMCITCQRMKAKEWKRKNLAHVLEMQRQRRRGERAKPPTAEMEKIDTSDRPFA